MFKKILSVLVLATALVACTDDYTDWSKPVKNDQPTVVSFGNGSVTAVAPIDFATLDSVINVKVCDIVAPTSTDGAYRRTFYKLHIGENTYDMTDAGTMPKDDLKTYIETVYGKAPTERTLTAYVEQWITDEVTTIKTATSGNFDIKATLFAPTLYPHLYLIGAPSAWDPTCTTLPFSHDDSKSVYDDPVFTITVPVADGDTWFAFADDHTVETADWKQVYGCREGNGKNLIGETGKVTRRTDLEDDGSFMIHVDGDAKFMKITVNVLEGTYEIVKLNFPLYLGVIGNHNSWGADEPIASPGYDGIFQGYVYLNGKFKVRQNSSWDAADTWGVGSAEGTLSQPGSDIDITDGEGVYQVNVDLTQNTYSLVKVNSITVVGNHNSWGVGDATCHMTYNVADKCWEATLALKDGFKFAMNDDWGTSWGGANDNPTAYDNLSSNGGKDLNAPEGEGTYSIKLYLACEGKNKVVLVKQ